MFHIPPQRTFTLVAASVFSAVVIAASLTPPAAAVKFTPSVSIPGTTFIAGQEVEVSSTSAPEYVKALYTFSVYAGSILAVVVLMVGGFLWLTAGGNVTQVGQAKTYIGGALSGFVLLLLSWTLLQTVNPKLVRFEPLQISPVANQSVPPPLGRYCCACKVGPEVTDCREYTIRVQKGTCACPGSAPIGDITEESCRSKGEKCTFDPFSMQTVEEQTLADCKVLENQPDCILGPLNQRCLDAPMCATLLKEEGILKGCRTDFECPDQYSCNRAWYLDEAGVGRELPQGRVAPPSYDVIQSAMCRPIGDVGDACATNDDCQEGLVCGGDGYLYNTVGKCSPP